MNIQDRLSQVAFFQMTPDLSPFSDGERRLLTLLFDAAQAMDDAFWIQNYGDREALLASTSDPDARRYLRLSYGPWDRLRGNEPFLTGVGPKPPGANFYPPDVTREEFEARAAHDPHLKSPYTMVRRDDRGDLIAIPYHRFFQNLARRAAEKLQRAADLAEEPGLRTYLNLRARALLSDDYRASDIAWVEMKTNTLDILIGPMEVADRLFGIKTAYAASILIKDWAWHERLVQFTDLLPRFQQGLPVPDIYKQEQPGLEGDLNVYEVLLYAGYDRMGPPLGIAWPNDEEVQTLKGTRSLLLRNTMQAHFEQIILPLADMLIAAEQRPYVTFEAYFTSIMLHELAHGLGIRKTINGKGMIREALGEQMHPLEEAKADLLSLLMMARLHEWGFISASQLRDGAITALARLLYQSDGVHAVARLNAGKKAGAYARDASTGKYRVHLDRLQPAVEALAATILRMQGDGDYEDARRFFEQVGQPDEALQHDFKRMDAAELPIALAVEYPSERGKNVIHG